MDPRTTDLLSRLPFAPFTAAVTTTTETTLGNHHTVLGKNGVDLLELMRKAPAEWMDGMEPTEDNGPARMEWARLLAASFAAVPELIAALDGLMAATCYRGHGDHKPTLEAMEYAGKVMTALREATKAPKA